MPKTYFLDGGISVAAIVVIVVVAVFVVAAGIVLGILLYNRHFKTGVEALEKDYSTYHTQLTNDCDKMVKRLGTLGKNNDYFQKMYTEKQKQYDELMQKRDATLEKEIQKLRRQVDQKNYKDYRLNRDACAKDTDEFKKSVCSFSGDLTAILQDDNDIHSAAVAVKEKYRRVCNFRTEHAKELKPLDHSFELIMAEAEKGFESFNRFSDEADFNQAKKTLADLSKLLEAVLKVMDDLPILESSVNTALPRDIDNVEAKYQEMLKEDYALDDMNVPARLADMRNSVKKLQDQLIYLDTTGCYEKINGIQDEITNILARFEEEKDAKTSYLNSQSSLSDSSYEIERRYASLVNALPENSKTYILSPVKVSSLNDLKSDIEGIGYLKRQLDSSLDTSERKPYVVITRKMKEMQSEMSKAKQTMDDYVAYINGLKKTSEEIFLGIRTYYFHLKEAERKVKDIALNSYSASTSKEFARLYNEIEEIDNIILTCPIDVTAAKNRYNSFTSETSAFIDSVNKSEKACKAAEEEIVKANIYRLEHVDAASRLDEAEKDFLAGDFTSAQQIAKSVEEMFKITGQANA